MTGPSTCTALVGSIDSTIDKWRLLLDLSTNEKCIRIYKGAYIYVYIYIYVPTATHFDVSAPLRSRPPRIKVYPKITDLNASVEDPRIMGVIREEGGKVRDGGRRGERGDISMIFQ